MKTEILPAQDPGTLARALAVLRHGGLVAFPTDTVYGVARWLSTVRLWGVSILLKTGRWKKPSLY